MPYDLKKVVELIDGGKWLTDVGFVTANQERQTGGEVIVLKKCRLAKFRQPRPNQKRKAMSKADYGHDAKNPLHSYHFTRNVELPNRDIKKIHPLLVFKINGETVV